MKAIVIVALILAVPSIALADRFVIMPDGGGCWIGDSGMAHGCSGGSEDSAADRARLQEAKNASKRQEQYKDCLRTADWPNNPSRQECADMYRR